MEIKYMLEDGAFAPEVAHDGDAGADLRTPKFVIVKAHSSVFIDTGVHVEIPYGYVGMLKSKSGLNVKHGITSEGVIDYGYESTIGVKLYNNSDMDKVFDVGHKISQLVILPIVNATYVDGMEIKGTERGQGGFGSTGV